MSLERAPRAKILCVDDEPEVLEGLALHLQRRYDMRQATSGVAALEILERERDIAVVLSDMRMPRMDGASFLGLARQRVPDAVRLLLTGHADLDSAIAAVNDGQVFRFLTKPCPPASLLQAFEAAIEQHRLVTAERVLLEQTLHGSIHALTEVLAMSNPASFGRATRIKQLVVHLVRTLEVPDRWQVEVAAMLSQLGSITLPPEVVEKLHYGEPLTPAEQAMAAKIPAVTEDVLQKIPRLERVRAILGAAAKPASKRVDSTTAPAQAALERDASILRIACDFDDLEAQGTPLPTILDTLRGRTDRYVPEVVTALAAMHGDFRRADQIRELAVSAVRAGMVLAADVKLTTGALLVARGYEVSPELVQRMRNFKPGAIREPIRVVVHTNVLRG